MKNPFLIQCATPPEFSAMHIAFGSPQMQKAGKRQYFTVSEKNCIVLRGSFGKVWAAASAEFAIATWQPGLFIDFGAAGALRADLRVGDLVLAEKVIEHDIGLSKGELPWAPAVAVETLAALRESSDVRFDQGERLSVVPAYPDFVELALGARATRGVVAAGDKDIRSLADRNALAESVGAIAATWESSAVGRICKFHGVPYFSLRVITDIGKDEFLAEYKAGVKQVLPLAARALVSLFELVAS